MTEFRIAPHRLTPGRQIVEVWENGVFIAAIYPTDGGIKIVSKFFPGRPSITIDPEQPVSVQVAIR